MSKILIALTAGSLGGLLIAGAFLLASGKPATAERADLPEHKEAAALPSPPLASPLNRENVKPVATMFAASLFRDYENNTLAADRKYKNQWVQVNGAITIRMDESNRHYAGFEVVAQTIVSVNRYNSMTADERKHYNEGWPPGVICYISKSAEKDFAELKAGSQVQIVGRCKGREPAPDRWKGYIVVLEECFLKK